ncbi:protein kinase [Altericista sp. CCNU0014]|uniref:protein kinase domain-containing protein n=1 Tax=Altericista sp. CCNU0014 TaxID=3082949 RepID=UPI00384CE945
MLVNGRYQILHPLQEGGFGHTFLAEDTQLPSRRRCVIKQLKPIQHNPEFYKLVRERFQREAAIQETLGEVCQQIPSLYAYFSENDCFYLVEEWVDGETLRQKVAAVGRFSEDAVRELLVQILATIETVHQHQIVHRDIKPDNIILRKRDGKPVLIDFGAVKESMATVINSQGQTARSIVIGTAGYMAPEQSAGRPVYTSDLYSLGLTAIYLLTGRTPAELDTDPLSGRIDWRSQAPHVSESLARAIDTAIQMHPRDRFASATAMQQALQASVPSGQGYETTVISRPQPGAKAAAQLPLRISAQNSAEIPTHVVAPATPVASSQNSSTPARNDWFKPIAIGASLGGVLLIGLMVLRGQPNAVSTQPTPLATPSIAADPTTAATTDPTPSSTPQPSSPPPEPSPAAAASCGDTGSGPQDWYPVFINNADLAEVRQQYCQDAIAKIRDDGTPAVQVASFTDRARADTFAQKVGGEVGIPYKIGASPTPASSPTAPSSPTPSPPASPSPSPAPASPPPASSDGTNAVIVGNKGETNIRRGPGTNFGVQHIAFPGDRVKILANDKDAGGFTWYKIYFPKSGASGWIAGQLLEPD